jgi:hypothetical protein
MNKFSGNDLSFLRQIKFRPERERRFTDGAGGSMHEDALASAEAQWLPLAIQPHASQQPANCRDRD